MKDFWKRKRNKRIAASALAVVMAGFLVWGLFPWQAAAAGTTVADDVTINNWHKTLDDSTKNVGRIWTDKSVSTEKVTLTNKVGASAKESATIEKGSESDFLVGLSALSSTAKIMGQTTVPLDIVLVLDVSGSMNDPSGSYEEVYDLNTQNAYYVLVNGRYQKVEYWSGSLFQGWYYSWSNTKVVPKTSANDSDPSHVQFYAYRASSTTKMEMLQDAVNGFIEKAAEKNNNLSDTNKQSRISLVKFAGDKTDDVGNDVYGPYKRNYTQIVKGYKTYTKTNMSELQTLVSALKPAGATRADYAMDYAKTLVEQSKGDANRKNAKRIVIFFTDGEPTSGNQFEDKVANSAITTAKVIKTDADIYTIGVFDSANASDTTGDFNAYMHGMSSNYPGAESYDNLGDRANGSDGKPTQFYKAATYASELNNIFNEIADDIVADAQSPTHVEQGENPHQSGYITFTDQLGDYMQVDDMNALVYANKIYTDKKKQESSDQSTITYTYKGEIKDPNHVYQEGNLNHIKITVKKSNNLQTGDLVTVMIPANMIPLRYYEVTKEGKMTISETYPMRLFYDVSLKDDAQKKIENPDEAMQAYIAANTNDKGQVQFYSNKYEVGADGKPKTIGAYSHFVPATTNDFYYFQEDTFLYKDEACTKPATGTIDTSGNTTYYYQRDYYELIEGKTEKKKNTVTIPGNSNLLLEGYAKKKDGQYYIPAGTPRTTSLSYFTENKAEGANKTGTAPTLIKPTWENNFKGKSVTTYLGNNGRISKDVPGALQVSKTVMAAEGHTAPSGDQADTFDFTVNLTAPTGKTLQNTYKAQIFDANEEKVGEELTLTTSNQGILSFKLQGGQHIKIYGLDAGVMYQVTESDKAHYTKQKTGDSGTIEAGKTAEASFTNTYMVGNCEFDTAQVSLSKVFSGRAWKESDTFQFTIENKETPAGVEAPMPENPTVTVNKPDSGKRKAFDFGTLTFTQPGEYKYTVEEVIPKDSDKIPGVAYDYLKAEINILVTDNGKGQLVAQNSSSGTEFNNTYRTEELNLAEVRGVRVTKVLHGHDMAAEQFKFTIKADDKDSAKKLGIDENNGVTFGSTAAADGETATLRSSLPLTLTQSDIGKTYSYTFAETQGTAAEYTYDTNKYKLTIKTIDGEDGTLKAEVKLFKNKKLIFNKTVDKEHSALKENGVTIPFVNYYDGSTDVPGGTKASISASKTLNGRNLKDGEFTFQLVTRPTTGIENGTLVQESKNKDDGTIPFEALSYKTSDKVAGDGVILSKAVRDGYAVKSTNKDGKRVYTLSYRVFEIEENLGGVSYTKDTFDFNVIVTDNGDGTLKAETQYPQGKDKFEFINTYSTGGSIPMDINGSKVLNLNHVEGLNPGSIAGKFTFTLEAVTPGAPMPKNRTATNDKNGNITFGDITYKLSDLEGVETAADGSRSKTFKYKVTEAGSAAGVTNDPDAVTGKTFSITLTDDGNGTLTATKDSTQESAFTFTNTYTVGELPSSITDQIKIDKQLTGRDLKKGEFTFELLEDGKVVATGSNDASGNVTFEKIKYTQPGHHTYTVREVNNDLGGVTYDDQAYTVYTEIIDQGNGTLKAKHQAGVQMDNEFANKITFHNKYEAKGTTASIGAVKRLTGKDLKDGQFTFQLKDENGKVIDEAKNDKAGAISFKALEFDKAGTYKYTISEVNDKQKEIKYDTSEKAVTITVKDSGDGYLQAQVESEKQLIFTNTFEAAGGSGTKTGDNMNLVLPIMMMLTAAAIGSVLLIRRKYHR